MEVQASAKEILGACFEAARGLLTARKHKELRSAVERAKEDLTVSDRPADLVPVLLGLLDTKVSKVLQVVFDSLQKLVSSGYLTGLLEDLSVTPTDKLVHSVIDKVCSCAHTDDETVHLQVLNVLLSVTTNPACQVHGKHLFESFRTCYHIYLISKHPVNQATAKAVLTRIVHFTFQQMELAAGPPLRGSKSKVIRQLVTKLVDDVVIHAIKSEAHFDPPLRSVPLILHPDDPDYSTATAAAVKNEEAMLAGKFGWCVECRGSADFYCKDSRDPVCSEQCKQLHIETLDLPDPRVRNTQNSSYFDALMIFKRVCKLSLRELGKPEAALTRKSKTISLELVLAVMDDPGKLFLSEAQFVYIIKSSLCESLLKNSVSTDKTIYALSLAIFVGLVTHFKDQLKAEIALFMNGILIRLLESTNSQVSQKLTVIEVFQRITSNPRTTLELFLNYDCNVDEHDIFAHMVDILRKVALSRVEEGQEYHLKAVALETLVGIMTAQAAWLDHAFARSEHEDVDDAQSDSSENTTCSMDQFEKNKQLKNHLSRAVAKFNVKPASGLQYLADTGYLNLNSPQEIACFLKGTAGINKTLTGEYLGSNKPAQAAVLHEFVGLFQFQGASLLSALREFLSSFRIPGEGQVVDRIMEKFAEKYCRDNPQAFVSPDSAFLLSFGIMMLQTDLHNPTVKQKMPLSQFCIMFSQDPSLSQSLLEDIYNEVKANPFTLQEDEEARAAQQTLGKKKHEIYAIESEMMYRKSHEIFKRARKAKTPYFVANDVDYLKTLFMSLWHPLLATFSIILEESEDSRLWSLCLRGFLACIKIACRFGMALELEIFLSSLAKFTSLIYLHNQVSEKNIECMKALIELAKIEANFLKGSWVHVLKCLSRLDYLHLISSRNRREGPVTEHELISSESINGHITPSDIDSVFNSSVNLDDEAIVDFVTTLVNVSVEELWKETPQTFTLQALVNVADLNMGRMRFVWGQVWHCVKPHFLRAGVHPNQHIASFAVDSLKQLAIKFLKKEELSSFNFQKEFLQPFEAIASKSQNLQVKELVIDCMTHFVYTMVNDLKSGWHSIFEVFTTAARQDELPLLHSTMQALEHIVHQHLLKVHGNYHDLLTALSTVLACSVDILSIRSIELIWLTAEPLANGDVGTEHWSDVFAALTNGVLDRRHDVQMKALPILAKLWGQYGSRFDSSQWILAFNASIQRLCNHMSENVDRDWLNSICTQTFYLFVEVMANHWASLQFLVPTLIHSLANVVKTLKETSAKVAVATMTQLVSVAGPRFSPKEWSVMLTTLSELLAATLPQELNNESFTLNLNGCVSKCLVQLYLLEAVKKLNTLKIDIPTEALLSLEQPLLTSYRLAKDVNQNIQWRQRLRAGGFLPDIQALPGLFKQEKEGLRCLLDLYFGLVARAVDKTQVLYEVSKELLQEITQKSVLSSERREEVANLLPVVSTVLLPGASRDLRNAMKYIGEELMNLVVQDDLSLREQLRILLVESMQLMKL